MQYIIYILLNYLNQTLVEDTNTSIARTILKHIHEIEVLSLEECATLCNVSTSTLHRFCKLIGMNNYKELKSHIKLHIKQEYNTAYNKDLYLKHMEENFNYIENIPVYDLDHIVDKIIEAKYIYFYGYGNFQYAALYMQKELFSHGIISEVKHDIRLKHHDDALIIITSMNGKFFESYSNDESFNDNFILITLKQDEEWMKPFKHRGFCGIYSHDGLDKYCIMRYYERILLRIHEKLGKDVYE